MLSETEETNAAVAAYSAAITRLTEILPGAYSKQGETGTRLWFTGLPIPTVNAVLVDEKLHLGEIEAFAKELSGTGVPWSIQTRTAVDPALAKLAAQLGMTSSSTLPLLVWDLKSAPSLPTEAPRGTTVRKVSGAESPMYVSALVDGFEMPEEVAQGLGSPTLLDAPEVTGFVLDLDGTPVSTGLNIITGEHVGLFNGSVPPEYRRNGYYRALVAARLQDALARGARWAYTQNTPMSRPLYESLGFRHAETWTVLTPES